MAFLKNIWKNNGRHKKLSEEQTLAKSPLEVPTLDDPQSIEEGGTISFAVKYLGSTPVEREANEQATAEAIRAILRVAKASGKKIRRVQLNVGLNGIKVIEEEKEIMEVSIYRISYCSADASNARVFAFIASTPSEQIECHAFLCAKRKLAQSVTLTVARAFSMAYEAWRVLPSGTGGKSDGKFERDIGQRLIEERLIENQLIDFEDYGKNDIRLPRPKGFNKNDWVSFDEDADSRWLNNDQNIDLKLN